MRRTSFVRLYAVTIIYLSVLALLGGLLIGTAYAKKPGKNLLASTQSSTIKGYTLDPTSGPANAPATASVTPPANVTFTKISSNSSEGAFTLALTDTGQIYSWGSNDNGQLGNGNDSRSVQKKPHKIKSPEGVRFIDIATSSVNGYAVSADHHLYAWGGNYNGQLAMPVNDVWNSSTPIDLTEKGKLPNTVTAVYGGLSNVAVITSDHRVFIWGNCPMGQAGLDPMSGANPIIETPIELTSNNAFPKNVIKLSLGENHVLALTENNHVYSWGANGNGALGVSTNDVFMSTNPIDLVEKKVLKDEIADIIAGANNSFVITRDHRLLGWGANQFCAFGEANPGDQYCFQDQLEPLDFTQKGLLPNTIISFTTGRNSTLAAITSTHDTYTWGFDAFGSAGANNDNMTSYMVKPKNITALGFLPKSVVQASITAVSGHYLTNEGHIYACGMNFSQELGVIAGVDEYMVKKPLQTIRPAATITGISFFNTPITSHTTNNTTKAWMFDVPQHPAGTVDVVVNSASTWIYPDGNEEIGTPLPDIIFAYTYKETYVVHFSTGGSPEKAPSDQNVEAGGTLKQPNTPHWKQHWFLGWYTEDQLPWDFTDPVTSNMTLTAKWEEYDYSLTPDSGPTIGGTLLNINMPASSPKNLQFTKIAAGNNATMVSGADGNLYGWGDNQNGQLGCGNTSQLAIAYACRVQLPENAHPVSVALGKTHTVVLASNQHTYAWGSNSHGQLGITNIDKSEKPIDLTAQGKLPENVTQVIAGDKFSMALTENHHVYTWGTNSYGELGTERNSGLQNIANPTPTDITALNLLPETVIQLSTQANHILAITHDKHVFAWGSNSHGQLGKVSNSPNAYSSKPEDLSALGKLPANCIQVAAGKNYSLVLTENGHIYSWGSNANNSLGRPGFPNDANNDTPTDITSLQNFPSKIVQIESTDDTALALTQNQHVITWGANQSGQLGTADSGLQSSASHVDLTALGNIPESKRIAAGNKHLLAVSATNATYSWGSNTHSQLGTPSDPDSIKKPKVLSIKQEIKVTGFIMDDTELDVPVKNLSTGSWQTTTKAHELGEVTSKTIWTMGNYPQEDLLAPFTFIPTPLLQILPSAGSNYPIQTLATLLFTLGLSTSAAIAAKYVNKKRKQ